MKSKGHFIDRIVQTPQITIIACALLVLCGIVALVHMPRQEFPEFSVREGLVIGIFPGASSQQVEEQLTRAVENYLFSYQEVDKRKTVSYSRDGEMIVTVAVNDNVKNPQEFWSRLRHGLNELKQQLPPQVVALITNTNFGNTSAVLLSLTADHAGYPQMDDYLKIVESEIRKIGAVSCMNRCGDQHEEIHVYVNKEKLAWYGIKPATLFAVLQGESATMGGGQVTQDNLDLPIHVPPSLESEKDLAEQIVYTGPRGSVVRVKDVARVAREMEKPSSFVRSNGAEALVLSIEMQPGNNIVEFGRDVDAALKRAQQRLPQTVHLAKLSDAPCFVNASVGGFLREFFIAICAVIGVTMLLLPLRVAGVAAITIPAGVFITLAILQVLGIDLNTVSLAGLILVLGMIVDNAIVVIDDYVDRLDKGETRREAARKSVTSLFTPVFTATLAIIVVFIPIGIMTTGVIRDFVHPLAPTITVALLVSLVLSVVLVPIMNSRFIRRGLKRDGAAAQTKRNRPTLLEMTENYYDRVLAIAFKYPRRTIAAAALLFVIALAGALGLPQRFLPAIERNQFAVEIYLPTGSSLKETDSISREVENTLMRDRRVRSVTAFVGCSSPRFHTLYAPNFPAKNYAQLVVITSSNKTTLQILNEYAPRLAEAYPQAHIRWKQLEFQKNPAPIEVRIAGDSLPQLRKTAEEVKRIFRGQPGVVWVRDNYEETRQGIGIAIDRERANLLGIGRAGVAASLGIETDGLPVSSIWEGDHRVDVRMMSEESDRKGVASLNDAVLLSTGSTLVPLRQVATPMPDQTEGQIVRRNGVRTMTVSVDVDRKTLPSTVLGRAEPFLKRVASASPGVELSYGGERETEIETYTPLIQALLVTIVIIFFILLVQFKRTRLALLVMMTMPMGFPGMVLGLRLTGYAFSATAFIGFSGLMGMVVRSGIIYLNYTQELIALGMVPRDAARAAARRRMRPIILTSAAAAVGVIPMMLSGSSLWGPLGTVICFGLIASTVMMLVVLPLLYLLLAGRPEKRTAVAAPAGVAGTLVLLLVTGILPQDARAAGPVSLETCYNLAASHNADICESDLEVKAAQQTRTAALTKWFPQVGANAQCFAFNDPLVRYHTDGGNLPVYTGDPATLPAASQYAYLPGTSLSLADRVGIASVTIVQPVYAGGRIYNGNRLAAVGVAAAEEKARIVHRDVRLTIGVKYRRAVGLAAKQKTLDAYAMLLAQLRKEVESAVSAGLATVNDRLKVSIKQQEIEVDRHRLEEGRKLALADLLVAMGMRANDSLTLSDTLLPPQEADLPGASADTVADARPELALLRQSIAAQRLQVALQRGEALPTISIGAAALHIDLFSSDTKGIDNTAVFGLVSVPLSAWWGASHSAGAEERRLQEAQTRLADTHQKLQLQLLAERNDLLNAWRTVQYADSAIVQASVNEKDCGGRFHNGLSTVADVLDAQALRQDALNRRIDAHIDFWNHRDAYDAARGISGP